MQDGATLATQVANYKSGGPFSGGKSLGQLGVKSLRLPVSDSDLQRLALEAYKSKPNGGSFAFVPAISTYETKVFVRPGSNIAVVAFKGTDPKRMVDLYTDIRLATGHLSDTARVSRSRDQLATIAKALPGYRIVLTGHSLGGSLAREVSNHQAVDRAVGFNTGYAVLPKNATSTVYVRGSKKHHKKYHSKHPKFSDYLNNRDIVSIGSVAARKTIHTRYSKSWGLKAHKPSYFK